MIFDMLEGIIFVSLIGILTDFNNRLERRRKIDEVFYNLSYTYSEFQPSKVAAAVIYVTCKEPPFPAHRFKIPSYNIKCNPAHRRLLCNEAIPMLDYFIKFYGKFPAHKLIFIHGHEKAWHYRTSVIDVVNRAYNTDKFKRNDYGALYRICWHGKSFFHNTKGEGPAYKRLFQLIYANTSIYKYLNGYKIAYPCCATFYVNSSLITNNPLSLYKTIRERLINWSTTRLANNQSARMCGYVMEYSWSMLLNHPYVDQNTSFVL